MINGPQTWHTGWARALETRPTLQLFALVDAAQDRRVLSMIGNEALPNECLFGYDLESPIALSTPRLVAIANPQTSRLVSWLLRTMPKKPVATLLASPNDLTALAAHLRHFLDVELDGIDSMFLALWDPAILGTLVGQVDDTTLHVPGPVLERQQLADLIAPMNHWWYCDREGRMHDAVPESLREQQPSHTPAKLVLEQPQIDDLVEASVPDHLLQHIRQNQPELLERLASRDHYRFVRQQMQRARSHGLEGTGDLVNYVCLALAYGAEFDELPSVAGPLSQVRAGKLSFGTALDQISEAELEAGKKALALL
jgi:hypothetical protein